MADTVKPVMERKRFILTNYGQKCAILATIVVVFVNIGFVDSLTLCENTSTPKVCAEGTCVNGTCVCFPGWAGEYCEQCLGRISLDADEGIIYDGGAISPDIVTSYPKDRMCSWLLDTHHPEGNVSLRLVFREFQTECGWDHFYIHDGDSVFSPLLAAYSGLLLNKGDKSAIFEFHGRLTGRYGYLHFYSDAAYTMSGFNISYSVGGCFLNCSQHGVCEDGVCRCDHGWSGNGCEQDSGPCPNNCSDGGTCTSGACACDLSHRGKDCSWLKREIMWERLDTDHPPSGRASHVGLLQGDFLWVVGGYSLSHTEENTLAKYDLKHGKWSNLVEHGDPSQRPWPVYAHSTVLFENKLYVNGGVKNGTVTDELWEFDIDTSQWKNLSGSEYPVSGHTAHVVDRVMLVFFGYSPVFGYLNLVQQYHFDSGEWSVVDTKGANVQGGYGHASTYDERTKKVYIFGGYHSHSEATTSSSTYNLTDVLYVYDVVEREWRMLLNSGHPRYLHSMVFINDYLLVFGGNTHNDTSQSRGAKCFSSDFLLYDIKCNSWHNMTPSRLEGSARFGHSMVVYDQKSYMFGGFDSLMLNDLVRVTFGDCAAITSEMECKAAVPGMHCSWSLGKCTARPGSALAADVCDSGDLSVCPGYNTCTSCVDADCIWCGGNCTSLNCTSSNMMKEIGDCKVGDTVCSSYHTCQACKDDLSCTWEKKKCILNAGAASNMTANKTDLQAVCKRKPCAEQKSCNSCTENSCMWCSNLAVCIDTNAYVASFPYGQCMDWTTKTDKCNATECSGLKSCKDCLSKSKCGWCNGLENDGLGVCMDGGMTGPIQSSAASGSAQPAPEQCPADRWSFTVCPLCQCNGHATCQANSSVCDSCGSNTQGTHCEQCQHFFYGDPVNNGTCAACYCHGQANSCNQQDGQCYCHTRGVKGRQCERCDEAHNYFGDPNNGGTCYYGLSTDYQYIFNLSKAEDINYTQINFLSIPQSGDRDVDFTLNCSGFALINITYKLKNQAEEQVITSSHECEFFRTKFEHKVYSFGGDSNSTFYVYVYSFKTPFWLQISFSQFPKIDLVHFFITFFSCFLSLLLIAAVLWKIKHKCDSCRRRQQLMVEMQAMASRPFSSVCVEVEKKGEHATGMATTERKEVRDHVDTALRRRKKLANKPSAIALEPTNGNKAAVLTLLVQLPFGDGEYAPSGQSGMAVGSVLVSIGTTRKQSLEHIKGDKPKTRKHLLYTHPDSVQA